MVIPRKRADDTTGITLLEMEMDTLGEDLLQERNIRFVL